MIIIWLKKVHKQYAQKYYPYKICVPQCIVVEHCSLKDKTAIIIATDKDDMIVLQKEKKKEMGECCYEKEKMDVTPSRLLAFGKIQNNAWNGNIYVLIFTGPFSNK